jgi:uncharacterized protein YbjT (DUF2867 family)
MSGKTAVIFGSSGLIGTQLLELLLADDHYAEVKSFVRHASGLKHPKLRELQVDFSTHADFSAQVAGDAVFCCLGTTIKTAGSKEAFRKIDFDLVKWVAERAKANGAEGFYVISSLGADASSMNFYYKTKGEMEQAVMAAHLPRTVIFRPSMLLGNRKEFRPAEFIGKYLMLLFYYLTPPKYRPIHARTVARAMLHASEDTAVNGILESDRIRKLAGAG